MKRQRRRLERRFLKSGLHMDKKRYNDFCIIYHGALDSAKRNYFSDRIENSDCKNMFRIVQSLSEPKSKRILPDHDNPETLAEDFARSFHTKIANIRTNLDATNAPPVSVNIQTLEPVATFELTHVSKDCVREVIMNLSTKTCVLDPIPTNLLKKSKNVLLPVITDVVNVSFTSGIMPSDLKTSHVSPILKQSNLEVNNLSNYRPVSQIPFIAKVVEKCACNQLHEHCQANNLYPKMQSAYRSNHSTETALLRVHNDLLRALDERREVVIVLLDLSTAFDTIDHTIFLNRLESYYGLSKSALSWFALRRWLSLIVNRIVIHPPAVSLRVRSWDHLHLFSILLLLVTLLLLIILNL